MWKTISSYLEPNRSNTSVATALNDLKLILHEKGKIDCNNTTSFIFVCGANQSPQKPSARREAIIAFGKKQIKNTSFFIAEDVFETLRIHGHNGNLLDIEHGLSEIADYIIIILESESAFAELGVFSNKVLRKKIIVINDLSYQDKPSFINMGPIKAIAESTNGKNVLYYKMTSRDLSVVDAIGSVFAELKEIIENIENKPKKMPLESLHPGNNLHKYASQFVHDLIYMCGPISHKELVDVCKFIFGPGSYDKIKHHCGFLRSINAVYTIDKISDKYYMTTTPKLFFSYHKNSKRISRIVASFRNFSLKAGRI